MGYLKKLFIVTVFAITVVFNLDSRLDTLLIDITVETTFDNESTTNTVTDINYGMNMSLDGSLSSQSGYSFAYWIVNGVLEEDLASTNSFTVTQEMDLEALFVSTNQYICVFRDTNGTVLDYQYISEGSTCTDPDITYPSKPGYTISSTSKWGEDLEAVYENKIYTLNYVIDTSTTCSLTVTNGTGSGTYDFNTEVTVSANAAPIGESFSHWEENGQIVSRNATETFNMIASRTIEAIYTEDTVSNAPYVFISEDVEVRTGSYSYIGRFLVPDDFTLIEWGMISNATPEFDLDTTGITVHQGLLKMAGTNAFMMSFDQTTYNYVRAYIVLKDYEGDLVTMYSDTEGPETIGGASEVYYTTDWEDCSKGSYAEGTVTSYDQIWNLNDAMIGTLTSDLKVDSKSIRSRTGYVTSQFTVANLSEISFQYGTFGSDSNSNLYLEISTDSTTWTTLTTLESGDTLASYTHTLDSAEYTSLGLDSDASYYIRFRNDDNDERINIDEIQISTGGTTTYDLTLDSMQQSTPLTFTLPENLEDYYTEGEEFTADMCTATDIVNGNVACTVDGVVDNEEEGLYTMTYSATSYEGIVYSTSRQITILSELNSAYLSVDYTGYYDGIEGLYGEDLVLALRTIINTDITRRSYDEVRYDLETVDADPDISGNVLLIYTGASITGEWDSGATWNREHVWPNSRLGVERVSGSDRNIATDLHNLRACNTSINSSRSNKVYDYTTTYSTYFPNQGEDDRGDVARIIFYMYVMYEGLSLTNDEADITYADDYTYQAEGAVMGYLNALVEWNYADDVSVFEQNRNEAIYSIQGNRNPFIDYPYLVELIWYDNPNIPAS